MNPKHIIESQQFTVPLLMELFERTRQMKKIVARGGTRDYERKILATLFYQPSTRTRFSFEAAMMRLGGKVLTTEKAGSFSSAIPGEHLEDTVRVTADNCDVIVLRHNEEGATARAASVSPVPVINAGEGPGGQHPTQALLDLYTIYDECKTLDGLSVALVGALGKSRTGRSLTYLLGKFARVRLYFVARRRRCRSARTSWRISTGTTSATSLPTALRTFCRAPTWFIRSPSTARGYATATSI